MTDRRARLLSFLAQCGAALLACSSQGCGSSGPPPEPVDYPAMSAIQNVVLIVQENHSFDSYFGAYCQAAPGSNPACTDGPSCCEMAPTMDPNGISPSTLDDTLNGGYDPDHTQACMVAEIDGGAMDGYTQGPTCADARNFAVAGASAVQPYWDLADRYALADRYFHPVAGSSSSNDMYFAAAQFKFLDNTVEPNFVGSSCGLNSNTGSYTEPMIGDLLEQQGLPWRVYAEGLTAMREAVGRGACPSKPADCPFFLATYPCTFDPSDIPFAYYATSTDDTTHFADLKQFEADMAAGTLPAFSFIKLIGYKTEHPGLGDTISAGTTAVTDLVDSILGSLYESRTLVLITWDESGGYYDHIAPPPDSAVDGQPYGARVPLLVVGPFARTGQISHVELEHSSVVRFLEWNFLNGVTGQLAARDAVVNNLGSLIDATAAGIDVPN